MKGGAGRFCSLEARVLLSGTTVSHAAPVFAAPTGINLSNSTVAENRPAGTLVGVLSAVDPDVGGTYTYTLVAGSGADFNYAFQINGNQLQTKTPLNFEFRPSYSIRVRVTDQGNLSYEKNFTINAVNVNEAPTGINLSNSTVAENRPAGTLVGVLSAVDPDAGGTFNYELVAGSGADFNYAFQINGNQLKTKTPLNFEFRPSYSIRVRVTDQGGLSYDKNFTINAVNVNEAPIGINLSKNRVLEKQPAGTLVGVLSAVDPDAGGTFNYELVAGSGADFNYAFQINGNQLKTKTPLNFEFRPSYSIRVRVTDQGGLSYDKNFTINAVNVNEAPTGINLSNSTVAENRPAGTLVGVLSAVDPAAGGTFTYKLVGGSGSDFNYAFRIDGNQLKTKTPLNFEFRPSYSIRVRVTDQGNLSYEKNFTINALNVNEAPTGIKLSNNTVLENRPAGTLVGVLSAVDPDAGGNYKYELVAGSGADFNYAFRIDGNQLKTKTPLNFEFRPSYSIRVRVTDQGGLSYSKNFTIKAVNVNDAPTGIKLSNNTVLENRPAGTLVGVLSAVDPDAGGNYKYELVAGSGADFNYAFRIDGNQLKTKTPLNFEFRPSYSIRVRVTDQGGLSYSKNFTINAVNVNEAPTGINLSNSTVAENRPAGTLVGVLSAVDPDAGGRFAYSLVAGNGDNDNSRFQINGNQLQTKTPLNFESRPEYSIRVRVTDQGRLTYVRTFKIVALDVNDPPTSLTLSNSTFEEKLPVGSQIGVFTAFDPDRFDQTPEGRAGFKFDLVNDSAAPGNYDFSISGNKLLTKGVFDFEHQASYRIRVRVTDSRGASLIKDFEIKITSAVDDRTPPL